MNKEQRKYILERIDTIANCKCEALRNLDKKADLEVTPYADLVRYYIFGHDKQTCQPPARS